MNYEQDIEACLSVLNKGGLILYPTDTIWGIGCDATNEKAVEKIYKLKNRPTEKAMIVLVASEKDILQYVANPDPRVFEYLKQTKKPTTIVYESAIGLAENLIGDDGTIAIRICQDDFCRHLIKRFRKPIVSTSANLTGNPAPMSFTMIENSIRDGVDYIVKYRRDDPSSTNTSTLVKWNKDGTVSVLRP